MGLLWLLMASYGGLGGIQSGLTKSTDHPSMVWFMASTILELRPRIHHVALPLRSVVFGQHS